MARWILSILLLSLSPTIQSQTKGTGLVQVEGGLSYPQNHLTGYISSGSLARVRVFGGAKIKFGAVGLGLDISYADYELKEQFSGTYKRILWDWLFIPVNIGILQITPGVAWVITDVDIDQISLKEQSIRPAAVLSVGAGINILPNFALTFQIRGEKVWEDMEPVSNLEINELNITGDFISASVGGMVHF